MTNSRLTDPEILEQRFPVQLEQFGFRRGSGGAGRWKGGDGLLREIRFLQPMTAALLSGSRTVAPFGLAGGDPGAPGSAQITRADGTVEALGGCVQMCRQSWRSFVDCHAGWRWLGIPAVEVEKQDA